jgi:hypothetical protein
MTMPEPIIFAVEIPANPRWRLADQVALIVEPVGGRPTAAVGVVTELRQQPAGIGGGIRATLTIPIRVSPA